QALQHISLSTGGRFFRAEDSNALNQVYATLDSLTPHTVQKLSHQPKRDLFWIPLGAAVGLLALYHLIAALAGRVSMAGNRSRTQET
ncbi:MAG: hypothetical protein ACRERX_00005, partial [Pseudomonas sp.]